MHYKLAAFLDIFPGRLLLRLIYLLPPLPKKISVSTNFKNVLIMKFWGIGSILETTPFLRALKRKYPEAAIDILTFSENQQIAESLRLFRHVYVINLRQGIFSFFWQTMRFILGCRGKYSLVIDLEFFAYFSALVTKMLGSKYALGFKSFFTIRNRCYSRTVVFDHSSHVRIIFLKFLDALSIERATDITLSAPNIPNEKRLSVLEKFSTLKDNYIKIAVNINASELCLNRRWPEENFRRLIGFIQQDYKDVQIYLVGGEGDVLTVKSFYDSLPDKKGVHIVAGKLDALEFSYALSKMTILISSDSGPVHIAEAINIPTVCFFGPETPNLYGTMSDKSLVFYNNLFCSPCLNTFNQKRTECLDNQCLKTILPEEVYAKMKAKCLNNNNKLEKCLEI